MTTQTTEPTTATTDVTVAVHGKGGRPVEFLDGATVAHYLEQVDRPLRHGESVSLNGVPATLEDQVEPNSVLVVANAPANG